MKRSFVLGLLFLFLSLPAPAESEKQPASSMPVLNYIPNDVKSWKDDPFLKDYDLSEYNSYKDFVNAQNPLDDKSFIETATEDFAPNNYDTSVYMIGVVSVSVILPESMGGSEDWTAEEIAQVKQEVEQGVLWWAARQPNAHLTFIFNYEIQVPIVDEPIEQDGIDWWTLHTMQELGYGYELYGGTQYWSKGVYAYVNNQRNLKNADWGFVVFVVDSSNDLDDMFADGYFAFARVPGPFLTMTYDNAGYGINNMDAITAHETGHIFGAADQYAISNCVCSYSYGYLYYENQNCENSCLLNEPSIMKNNYPTVFANGQIDVYARGHVGWSDTNNNGILDIIDFEPQVTSNYSGREGNSFFVNGSANTTGPFSISPYYYRSIIINKIANVEYSVNNGAWNSAIPLDGSFNSLTEGYLIRHAVSDDENYSFKIRTVDRFGRITSEANYLELMCLQLRGNRYVSPAGGNFYPYTQQAGAAHSIQDAINAAYDGDSIMVAAGSYSAAIAIVKPVYLMGGWDAGFTARDPQANVTTITYSGGSVVSFLSIASGSPSIEGFNITGGPGTVGLLPDYGIYGGGIFVNGAPAVIKDNVITGCGYAGITGFSGGGGIACWNGSVTISGNVISDCEAQSGGGIYLYQATAAITGNTISGAQPNAEFSGTKNGGGIYARESNVTMAGNIISFNTGYQEGGGIYAKLSPLSTSGDSIYSNAAASSGGGICSDHSPLSMHNTYVTDNVASSMGGGIYHNGEQFDMANSLVASNRTYVIAGGVYAANCWGDWTNNTIDRNTSVYMGGNVFAGAAGALDVRNNIVTYGSPNGFQAAAETNITFQYNNCFGNTPGDVVTLLPDSTNCSRNPAYADTTSMDYYLGVHSGSIDAGDPAGHDPDGSIADQGVFGGPSALFAAPAYVQNLVAAATNDTTIEISWDGMGPTGLDYYAIYSDTASGFRPDISNFVGAVDVSINSFLHHPVNGWRHYRVCMVNDAGYAGGYSNEAVACAPGPDLIPPTVAVVYPAGGESFAPGDSLDIQWTATDNRQVDSVSIFYSENAGIDFILITHGESNNSPYRWIAPAIASDSCLIRIVAFDPGLLTGEDTSEGLFTIRATTDVDDLPAIAFSLAQNYPNPFNPSTTIDYSLARTTPVEIAIFDANGRKIRTLVREVKMQGSYKAVWNGKNNRGMSVASGVYYYRLTAGEFTQIKKMILLR